MTEIKELMPNQTVDDLNTYLTNETKAVILHLYGTYCPTCKRTQPLLEKVFTSYPEDAFNIVKINLHEHIDVAKQYNVTSIPTLIFIKRSEVLSIMDSSKFVESRLRYAIEENTDIRIG